MLDVICGAINGTNGYHLAAFSVDIAFVCHFMTPHYPSIPIGTLVVFGYPVKTVGNSASYPFSIDRYRIVANCMQPFVFFSEIQYFKQLKLVFLNIYKCE